MESMERAEPEVLTPAERKRAARLEVRLRREGVGALSEEELELLKRAGRLVVLEDHFE